jgi:hypothetical protein
MIIQLLGVALISLLTITPTLQQNNIEQLIAPNIETQDNYLITSSIVGSSLATKPFGYYKSNSSTYNSNNLVLSNQLNNQTLQDIVFTQSRENYIFYTDDNNLYFYDNNESGSSNLITGNLLRSLIYTLYTFKYSSLPITSESFSFATTNSTLAAAPNWFYTYSITNSQGTFAGRVYSVAKQNNTFVTGSQTKNNVISLPSGTNIQQIIQALNPQVTFLNSSADPQILMYSLYDNVNATANFNIPTTAGSYNYFLNGYTNYGDVISFGSFTLNITAPDTTSPVITGPTSLTFEVGTYSLIEQILNDLYTFTDNVGIEDAYYFPVTSINTVGTFNITVYATDAAGNQTNIPVTITTTAPPPNDTKPPVITGSNTITRELGQINNDAQLANVFNITDDFTQPSAIVKTISGTRSYTQAGTYNLTLSATDVAGNVATKEFTFIINAPVIDNEPPIIVSDLIVSITISDFTDRQEILDFYTTVTDNVALSSVLLVGDINFNVVGDYQLQIIATDTSQNQATRNILVRIREEVILGNYNPLTDLLSGIFGGALSMIFTIGTINVLGLRLLDAMGVIILGAVLLFVYKAIKGGS